jgi:hypothetical protein
MDGEHANQFFRGFSFPVFAVSIERTIVMNSQASSFFARCMGAVSALAKL